MNTKDIFFLDLCQFSFHSRAFQSKSTRRTCLKLQFSIKKLLRLRQDCSRPVLNASHAVFKGGEGGFGAFTH